MSKHLVKWSKPAPVLIGKSQLPSDREFTYTSKCGRFEIRKQMFASGRNGYFNTPAYKMTVLATGKSSSWCDTLDEAKLHADWEIDPNWEDR